MFKVEARKLLRPAGNFIFGFRVNLDGWASPFYAERPGRRFELLLGWWAVTLIVFRTSKRKWANFLAEYRQAVAP